MVEDYMTLTGSLSLDYKSYVEERSIAARAD